MNRVKFGTAIGGREAMKDVGPAAAAAERLGYDQLTILDDLNLTRDVFCMLAVAAQATNSISIGPGVTHPYVRHPVQTAVAMASIDELSGGRAFLGIGAGALYPIFGMRNANYADLREAVLICAGLSEGRAVTLPTGAEVDIPWIERSFPINIGADGPMTMRLAGELGDGVWIMGRHPELVRWRMEHIRLGLEASGRTLADIDIWLRCNVVLADSKEEGRDIARVQAATHAHQFVRATLERDTSAARDIRGRLPQSMLDDYRRVADAWSYHEHDSLDAGHAAAVSDQLVDTYAVVGTPEDCVEALAEALDLGFTGISVTTSTHPDKLQFWGEFQNEVACHLR